MQAKDKTEYNDAVVLQLVQEELDRNLGGRLCLADFFQVSDEDYSGGAIFGTLLWQRPVEQARLKNNLYNTHEFKIPFDDGAYSGTAIFYNGHYDLDTMEGFQDWRKRHDRLMDHYDYQ